MVTAAIHVACCEKVISAFANLIPSSVYLPKSYTVCVLKNIAFFLGSAPADAKAADVNEWAHHVSARRN